MANEFKIKKGLIVTGASGGTVVDIQGSQGQLFSVTDNLSGSIFAVSDISGVPILDVNSSGLVTVDGPFSQTGGGISNFSGNVTLTTANADTILTIGTSASGGIDWDIQSASSSSPYAQSSGDLLFRNASSNVLILGNNGSATFAGKITSGNDIVNATAGVYTWTGDTDTYIQRSAGNEITFKTGASTALVLNSSQNATFSAKAYGVAPITSDPDSTIATKGYVQSVITGATIYRGTWNPDVSLNSGYGNPNLNTVTQTSGYYYICSADGAATPNGATTEPNTWNTGDWVIWNDDVGTSGEWQKIDNSSVLSGVGTGQTVALWEGPNTVTDSETLGNAPITVSGNNTTFAGNVALTGDLRVTADASTADIVAQWADSNGNNTATFRTTTPGQIFEIRSQNNGTLKFDSSSATFTGQVNINSGNDLRLYRSDNATYARFNYAGGSVGLDIDDLNGDGINLQQAGVNKLRIETSGNATFAGNVAAQGGTFTQAGGGVKILNNGTAGHNANLFFGKSDGTDGYSIGQGITANDGVFRVYNNGTASVPLAIADNNNATFAGDVTTGPNITATGNTGNSTLTLQANTGNWTFTNVQASRDLQISDSDGTGTVMTINTSGNVGVGNISPGAKLVVGANVNSNATGIEVNAGASGGNVLSNGTADNWFPYVDNNNYYSASDHIFRSEVNANTRMTIKSSGNVGIGVTGPATKLEVSSSLTSGIKVTNSGTINGEAGIEAYHTGAQTGTAYAGYITKTGAGGTNVGIYTAASGATNNYGLIVGSGNVGIGDTSPSTKIDVYQSTVGIGVADFRHVNGNRILINPSYNYYDAYNHIFRGLNGTDTHMTIDLNGNVGIGTTSPTGYGASANTLEVRGASGTGAGLIRVSNAGNTVGAAFYSGSASSTLGTQTNHELNIATNNTSRVVIGNTGAVKFSAYAAGTLVTDASGNISVSSGGGAGGPYLPLSAGPSYPLTGDLYQTMGAIGVAQTDQDYLAKIYESNADGFMSLYTGQPTPLERIRISSYGDSFFVPANNGKVGIGTTTPNNLLSLRKDVADGDVAIYLQNYNSVIGSTNETVSIKFAHGNDSGTGYVGAAIVGGKEGDFESNPSNVKGFISFNTNNGSVSNVLNERMRIEAGGNVGIGTTNPTANLHISDTADAVLKIEGDTINSDETKGPKILLITDNGYRTAAITGGNATYETSSGNFNALNLQSKDIRFHTGTAQDYDLAVERMRITGTGALSFGTTGTAYGTSGQILKSNGNASPTWIDGSAIPGVPGGSGTLRTIPMWTPDGDTLGDSNITQDTNLITRFGKTATTATAVASINHASNDFLYINGGTAGVAIGDDNQSTRMVCYNNDYIRFDTAGSEKMRITSAGELQVTGNGVIRNQHSSANYSYWQQTASDARLFTQYAQPLYFGTNASTRMTILSGGNVGIGTTGPVQKLEVYQAATNSQAYVTVQNNRSRNAAVLTQTTNGGFYTGTSIGTDTLCWQVYDASAGERMRIDSAGVISIGPSTTSSEIYFNYNNTNNKGGLKIDYSTGELRLSAGESGNVYHQAFYTSGSEKMRITSTGNVGIGTSTPLAKLDIQGTQGQLFSVTDDLSGSIFAVSDISGVPIFDVNSSGKVGINTTSANDIFDVRSSSWATRIQSTTDGTYLRMSPNQIATFNSAGAGSPLYLNHSSSGNIIMAGGGGNVGIGTTSPTQKLHLDGNNYNTATRTTFLIRDVGNNYDQGDNAIDIVMRSRYWSGDQNTSQNSKIRHLKDNSNGSTGTQLRFSTTTRGAGDSSDKMTILASGNVGIGDTGPVNKLNVNGDIGYIGVIGQGSIYGNTGNSSYANMQLYNPATGYSTFNNQSYGYYFLTGGSTKLAILNNGNVGIGTTSPDSLLTVSGSSLQNSNNAGIELSNSHNAQTVLLIENTTSRKYEVAVGGSANSIGNGSFYIYDGTAGAARLVINSSGNSTFGGEVSLKSRLNLQRLSGGATTLIQFKNENGVDRAHIDFGGTNEELSFFAGAGTVENMRIDSSGNVGIGTTSPGSKLQVAGEIRAADGNKGTPSYTFTSDTNTGMYSDTADVIDFTAGGTKSLSVTTSGATVYGSALMPSNAAILLQNQNNNNQFYIRNSGVSDATFQVGQGAPGSNVRFFINGSGNVGIGNTASTASVKLEVTGNTLLKNSNGVGDLYLGNYATANHFRFHTNNANTYFDMNCGDIYWRQGTSTRYQFFPSTANMTVQGTITQNSDARIKENVVEISDCISKVQAMRGVYYNRTDFNTDVTKVGVIAQEVEAVLPELVLESPETGLKSVAYSELTSVLINAIKEQQEIIEDLKTRITKLEN